MDDRVEGTTEGTVCQVVHVGVDGAEVVLDLLLLAPMSVEQCEVPPGSTITIRFAVDTWSEGEVAPVLQSWAGEDDLITVDFRLAGDEQVVVLGGRREHVVLVLSGQQ